MIKPDIEAIRQSPRQFVDLETVEAMSDHAMILEEQLAKAQNSLEFKEALLCGNGTLIIGLQDELAEAKKHIVMLRTACISAQSALEFSSHGAVKAIQVALDDSNDLSGYILCDAEPIAVYQGSYNCVEQFTLLESIPEGTELYKARTP